VSASFLVLTVFLADHTSYSTESTYSAIKFRVLFISPTTNNIRTSARAKKEQITLSKKHNHESSRCHGVCSCYQLPDTRYSSISFLSDLYASQSCRYNSACLPRPHNLSSFPPDLSSNRSLHIFEPQIQAFLVHLLYD
jgi:hypothetical protein